MAAITVAAAKLSQKLCLFIFILSSPMWASPTTLTPTLSQKASQGQGPDVDEDDLVLYLFLFPFFVHRPSVPFDKAILIGSH